MIKIMFVCHGNICRSPMAEALFRHMIREEGLSDKVFIDSSATSYEEIGNPVHPGTRNKLKKYGISVDNMFASKLKRSDLDEFDYIFTMDQNNMNNIKREFGEIDQTNTEMLPADVQQFMFGKNDSTMLIVRFDAPSASDETMNAVSQIEKLLRKDCFFGGMSVILQDTKALVNQEMPLYILIAVGASLLVLFLSLESTITPLLFMLGLLFPIAYNFGTNIFLGQISYITEALATVLQLGVTMDFSIFLLHRYQEEKELRSNNEEAMVSAICKTMTSISASSLTTIAGFLALCAMRLTLGRDIGIVMAKGVALGVICTVVILPALILTFDKWVEKYKHRTVIPQLKKLSYFVSNHAVPIVVVFILIIIPFAIAQNKTTVYYTLFDSLPQDLTGIVGTNKLGEDFGMTTSHFILVHDDLTATQVSDLCDDLKDVDGITQVMSLDSITGPGFDTSLIPDGVMEILQSGGYKLILANSSYKTGTDAINNQLTEMNDLIKAADPEGVITGEGAMTKDLIELQIFFHG